MRIIGGTHKGTALAAVGKGDAGAHLRPTSDRVRESLFNILLSGRFGDPVSGMHVLDLFAGTGALGLEALSRGAETVTFVENGRPAQKLIQDNIAKLNRKADTTLLRSDATRLPAAAKSCELVFLDPPYGKGLGLIALQGALSKGWIAPGAMIVWEENAAQPAPAEFALLDQRRYGDTWITLLEAPK